MLMLALAFALKKAYLRRYDCGLGMRRVTMHLGMSLVMVCLYEFALSGIEDKITVPSHSITFRSITCDIDLSCPQIIGWLDG